jgi:hypothetical protein
MAGFVPVLAAFLYGGTLFEPRHAQLLRLGYGVRTGFSARQI